MQLFRIDWDRFVLLLLPIRLRVTELFVMARAIIQPVMSVHSRFMLNRADNLYKMSHNGQVCHLRAMLNDTFDTQLRRITIEDTRRYDWTFVYKENADKPLLLETVVIASEQFTTGEGTDFTVFVPSSISFSVKPQMISLINFYKLAGKRYSIIFN